jgi:hypothetical protein
VRVHHAHTCRLHVRASLLLAHCPGDGDLRPVCRGELSHHTARGLVQVVELQRKLGTVMRNVHAFNADVDEHDGANDCYRVLVG